MDMRKRAGMTPHKVGGMALGKDKVAIINTICFES